jgi:molybdate transport system substrate-binding protein
VLGLADVEPAIDTNEPNVRSLLTKVEAGELDAGIVYATDVDSSDRRVQGIDFPESEEVVAEYPIAILADAPNPQGAEGFVNFVLSQRGQEILRRYGFLTP